MPHTFRVTLKHVADHHGNPVDGGTYEFEAENHDNILDIIDLARGIPNLAENEAAAFALGLKLLTEVVMKHRGEAPFAEFWPHLSSLIRHIKKVSAKPESVTQ